VSVAPDADRPAAAVGDRAAQALPWRFAASVVSALFQFLIGVLLARLLPPAEFGLAALATVFLGLIQPFGDLGVSSAVVQRPSLSDRVIRTAFTFALLSGLAFAALLALLAPAVAALAGVPSLTSIVRVLSITFVFRGCAAVAGALLRRQLDFRALFAIETYSFALSYGALATVLALWNFGVWSLVWAAVAQAALASAAQVALVRHSVRPLLHAGDLASLLRFGFGAAVSGGVNGVALNADSFVIGRSLGPASLGLYTRAYSLMALPQRYAAASMTGVMFPAFSQLQGDLPRLQRGYLLTTRLTALLTAPFMAILAVGAPYIVHTLYGAEWAGVVLPLQILCAAGYFRALYHLGGVVVQSTGRIYLDVACQIFYAVLVVGGALAGAQVGLEWVAAAVGAAVICMYLATGHAAVRSTRMGWGSYLRAQVPALATAASAGVAAIAVRGSLEAAGAPAALIALMIVAIAAIPWAIGVLWDFGDPSFEPLRGHLPAWWWRLADAMPRRRRDSLVFVPAAETADRLSHTGG
jgi:PST family polysaccharide transporter